ncbi:hypothetical protein EYF80_056569 [Liparis tanakae]|uniref:Uncharacterized protein n=1 Tax=Liparis tanakae TaxID=230148 RepID=A0A4Z2EWS7_9TELE|nr:hypothetical protein EYF80_056569 [Liparis tanakae]
MGDTAARLESDLDRDLVSCGSGAPRGTDLILPRVQALSSPLGATPVWSPRNSGASPFCPGEQEEEEEGGWPSVDQPHAGSARSRPPSGAWSWLTLVWKIVRYTTWGFCWVAALSGDESLPGEFWAAPPPITTPDSGVGARSLWTSAEACFRGGKAYRAFRTPGKIHEGGPQTPLGCGSSCAPPTERRGWRKKKKAEEEEEEGLAAFRLDGEEREEGDVGWGEIENGRRDYPVFR